MPSNWQAARVRRFLDEEELAEAASLREDECKVENITSESTATSSSSSSSASAAAAGAGVVGVAVAETARCKMQDSSVCRISS